MDTPSSDDTAPATRTVANSDLDATCVIVGEAGGLCHVYGDARASGFGEGLVSVETEHGLLLLDPDMTSEVLT